MFKHIKLTTVSRLFAALMLLTCIILGASTLFLERNISLIGTNWTLFQTDRSEKSRLESALRAAIGYGGMIHEFKNYVLRQEPERMDRIQSHIGAAKAVLHQYEVLETSAAEAVALEDIASVLNHYDQALLRAKQLVAEGKSIAEIDSTVRIDDAPALRGLQTLRNEVRQALGTEAPLSKARISADLRATIGYGGMIHEFKNYVLRHDASRIARVKQRLQQARDAVALYRKLGLSSAEALALDDIEATLLGYGNKLDTVSQMIATGASRREIDQSVRIDDHSALRGLAVLDREVSRQLTVRSGDVSRALEVVERTLSLSTWGLITLLLSVVIGVLWLMQYHVIRPILRLNQSMVKLADNDLTVTLDDEYRDNEVGEMARTVMLFKSNMIERDEAGRMLSDINQDQEEQISTIRKLREDAQGQTEKALNLAEGMAAARESAEQAMTRAEQQRERVRSILDAVRDSIITIDTHGIIESINPATEEMFGYRASEMIGENISMLIAEPVHSLHDDYIARFVKGHPQRNIHDPAEQVALCKDGSSIEVEITLNTVEIDNEMKIMGVVRDITERKRWEEEIQRLAMTDPLTGLANRNQYNQQLEQTVSLSKRLNQPFALLLIDLDKFKPVNDTYGHPAGDALLQHVAQTLLSCCREVDTVARLGGDEFAVILAPIDEGLDTDTPAQRIIEQLSQPVTIDQHTINIGGSIGISRYPDNSTDIEELQRQADEALYQAKEGGRNTYRHYST